MKEYVFSFCVFMIGFFSRPFTGWLVKKMFNPRKDWRSVPPGLRERALFTSGPGSFEKPVVKPLRQDRACRAEEKADERDDEFSALLSDEFANTQPGPRR